MSSFIGKLKLGLNGLYVSTGGFTKSVVEEANGARYRLRMLDLDDLVDLITQHYDNFDSDARFLFHCQRSIGLCRRILTANGDILPAPET